MPIYCLGRRLVTQLSAPDNHLSYQSLFRATSMPTLVLDTRLFIVEVNDAYLKATGRIREQLVGRNVFNAFPDSPDNANSTSLETLRESFERVLQNREVDKIPLLKYNIPLGNPANREFEERYWSPVNTPLLDEHGNVTHILHHAEDVSARIAADAAKRDSEGRFRALRDATADVIYRMSADWKFMHQLDGRGFLKTTTAISEYMIEEYVHPDDLDLARREIEKAILNKSIFELEHRVRLADGTYGWTYSKAVPILEDDGQIREWIGSASNITERKFAEEQLKEASRRKDEFLAMLAHELRNPLAPINSAAQLLQLGHLQDEQLRQTSEVIERQVTHMTTLVDELLDVSRVSRGLITLRKMPLNISEVIADAVEQVAPLAQSKHHRLEINLSPEALMVYGDRKRLVQVVANLLSNACKFTDEHGTLQVATEVIKSHVRVEITDNGVGMTANTVSHAFDLFAQAERSSDRSQGGLGLGLALVKSLVELHEGTVTCHSAGLGTGSKFTILLPLLLSNDSIKTSSNDSPVIQAPATSLRILVVDDNEDAAEMLAILLETLGHQVVVENLPTSAIERASQVLPQVCLLDIGLPEMDGYQLAQRLRAQPETANATMIAITGYGQESDREKSSKSGFDHHLVKPVDIHKLRLILSEIC